MDCKLSDEPGIRLKVPMKSRVRLDEKEIKSCRKLSGLSNTANNTSPIVCAVCGSRDYITIHSERSVNQFAPGWSSPEFLKKNSLSTEFAPPCGTLNPLTQAIFPQLSLFQFPSSIYYSHYNNSFRFPSNPCVPIEKYYPESSLELDASKAATVNSESTIYRDSREKKKNTTARIQRGQREEYKYMKDDSRPTSAYTSGSEMKNYPVPIHPPWMGNICPIFPYTYASLAFPVNQPLIPIYFPMPGKWPTVENRTEEGTIDSSVSNSPMGDAISMKNDVEKKSETKEDNNTSEYEFEVLARQLMLDQKTNFDEDEEDEINLDEITSSLKIAETSSGRDINSEKFFNSKEKLMDSHKEGSTEKDEIQNWRLPSEINMQDCCIRGLSNENLWYEAQDGDKKNWDTSQEYESRHNNNKLVGNSHTSKHTIIEADSGNGDKDKEGRSFLETSTVWQAQERNKSADGHKLRSTSKKLAEKTARRQKISYGDSGDVTQTMPNEKRSEWSNLAKTNSNDEMNYSGDKLNSLADSDRLRDMNVINDQASKLDVRFKDYAEDNESTTQTSNRYKFKEVEEYTVQMQSIEVEYSISAISEGIIARSRNSENEELDIPASDAINFNWDNINEILKRYNEKFDELDNLLKSKQVSGAQMADAIPELKIINDKQNQKIKHPNNESFDAEKIRKIECKSNGIAQPITSLSSNINNRVKKDERPKSIGMTSSKYETPRIPVPSQKKYKKQEDFKKRWLS